jgi:phosphatidylglycerophosphate synthase
VSFVGKIKTTVQMLAIGFMLFQYPLGPVPVYAIGVVLLFAAAGLTLWSMVLYLLAAWPDLSRDA